MVRSAPIGSASRPRSTLARLRPRAPEVGTEEGARRLRSGSGARRVEIGGGERSAVGGPVGRSRVGGYRRVRGTPKRPHRWDERGAFPASGVRRTPLPGSGRLALGACGGFGVRCAQGRGVRCAQGRGSGAAPSPPDLELFEGLGRWPGNQLGPCAGRARGDGRPGRNPTAARQPGREPSVGNPSAPFPLPLPGAAGRGPPD